LQKVSEKMSEKTTTEENDTSESIVLVDSDGNEVEFVLIGIVEMEPEGEFALLTPTEQMDGDDDEPMDVYIFHYDVDEDGAESFAPVEDEELVQRVADVARPEFEAAEGEE
jgi:uncharacterized protein YrzB (UPF0473 family)